MQTGTRARCTLLTQLLHGYKSPPFFLPFHLYQVHTGSRQLGMHLLTQCNYKNSDRAYSIKIFTIFLPYPANINL